MTLRIQMLIVVLSKLGDHIHVSLALIAIYMRNQSGMSTQPTLHPLNLPMFSHTQASRRLARDDVSEPYLFLAGLQQDTVNVLSAINKRRSKRGSDLQRRQSKLATKLPEAPVCWQDEQHADKSRDKCACHVGKVGVVVDAEAVLG